jgi:FixJ family two-component response regulator
MTQWPHRETVTDQSPGLELPTLGTPIVFAVDDDASARESVELLICNAGWQSETFASAQKLLCRERVFVPSCLVLDVAIPTFNGLDL